MDHLYLRRTIDNHGISRRDGSIPGYTLHVKLEGVDQCFEQILPDVDNRLCLPQEAIIIVSSIKIPEWTAGEYKLKIKMTQNTLPNSRTGYRTLDNSSMDRNDYYTVCTVSIKKGE